MEIRRIAPEEKWRGDLVMAAAFEGFFDLEKAKTSAAEYAKNEPENAARNHMFGAVDTEKDLMFACVNSRRYACRFDGGLYGLGGVGGVSTLPPYRRSGAIRGCMAAALRDMYESGFAFSFLYPFRMQYYRKFGYESGAATLAWKLPFAELTTADMGGRVEQLFPGDDLSPLLEVYTKCFENVNLSAVRDVYDADLAKDNWSERRRFVYVWRDDSGAPRAYMITSKAQEDGKAWLNCANSFENRGAFLFLDSTAFRAMLHFMKGAFQADYAGVKFSTPESVDLTALVGENNLVSAARSPNGMLRVVNARTVLEGCKCRGVGSLRMEIADEMLPENSGVWEITYAPGAPNTVRKTEEKADVSLTINAFSALICGALGAADIPWMPAATVHNPAAALADVFYKKPCHMMDLF